MRRILIVAIAPAVALGFAVVALAAMAIPHAGYKGSGRLCQNNVGPANAFQACGGRDTFGFTTSRDGRTLAFHGQIGPAYCGRVTSAANYHGVTIKRSGTFSDSFSGQNISGGTAYGSLRGRFTGNGRTADVTYQLGVHFSPNPSGERDCRQQVSGTARTSARR